MTRALGLIEVMGLPGAVEAADAALKAANVTLLNVAKVGSGIMTVEITGDVGAVTAAVEAGALSASRITTLRAKHVIPRMDDSLMQTVVPWKEKSQKEQNVVRRTVETHPYQQAENSEENETSHHQAEKTEDKNASHSQTEGNEVPHQQAEETKNEEMNPLTIQQEGERNGTSISHESTTEALSKLSNSQLRSKIHEHGITLPEEELKRLKKQELVNILERHLKESKEKGE